LLYNLLKIIVRTAFPIFCRKIRVNKPAVLNEQGPLLLACNHPNSFLDGVILDVLFEEPVYSLTRGDVFKKPFYIRILRSLKLLPVYRVSEGVENLSTNYETFDECKEIFRNNGIIIIFSEGKCINEWRLRPLKKGTARLAFSSWEENIPLKVLPVGINYSSFRRFGKNIFINFGNMITVADFNLSDQEGLRHQQFNDILYAELKSLVFEIDKTDKKKQIEKLAIQPSLIKKLLLAIPAMLGWLIHLPVYLPIKNYTIRRTGNNDHYDSVITALLVFTYPVYILLICLAAFLITGSWFSFILILLIPLTAWCCVQVKPQIDK
jgi:1-acyl-sn-glycerol-3-phosphate acyltransferase